MTHLLKVKLSDDLQDDLLEIQRLFMDLLDISDQLLSVPTEKIDIEFYKKHKKRNVFLSEEKWS